jgi:hypothetical protein
MRLPPLLSDRPQAVQVLLVVVVPLLLGAVAGIFLGISAAVYLLISLLAALGGLAAGLEHLGAVSGAKRGAIAGAAYGAGILIAHQIAGTEERVELSHPPIVLIVFTLAIGAVLSALGGSYRAKREVGDKQVLT